MIIRGDGGYSNQMRNLTSAVLPVIAGDWFELALYIGSSGELKSSNRTWFTIEVVETEDALDPPSDINGLQAGQPSAAEVLRRLPIIRRTRMKIDLADSQAVAAVSAVAQTDFDMRRNRASFATMRFAASGSTASFIAASETVLEPGDVLSIAAPSSPGVTLADTGFALAGALVV